MLTAILANWKTTAAGLIILAAAVLHSLGVDVPGFSGLDLGQAIIIAAGLILAHDATAFRK